LSTACAEIEIVLGSHAESVARLERLLGALPAEGTSAERAAVELQLALGAAYMLDVGGVTRWADRVLASARGADDALEAAGLASVALASYWRVEPDTGAPQLERAEAAYAALEDGQLATRPDASWALGAAQVYAERWGAATRTLERGIAVARATNQDRLFIPLSGWRTMALCNAMQVDAARPVIEAAEEAARLANLEFQLVWAMWLYVRVLDAQGEALDAHRLADEVRSRSAALDRHLTVRSALVNVALVHREEDPERALREMTAAGGDELELLDPIWVTYPMFVAAQAAIAAGRVDEAEAWADRLARNPATTAGMVGSQVRSLAALAAVRLARDDAEGAVAVASEAADQARVAELGLDEFEAGLVLGRALAAAGRREEAADVLQGAATLAADGGARKMVDAAGRELRRIGSRLAAGTARAGSAGGGLDGLTDREREIAALVAEGKSNKQVAAAVFLSEKTVEHHLSRIFAKVGVRSRVELTRIIAGG
jgi:DNA-binding NarL/FixJ family response regulator